MLEPLLKKKRMVLYYSTRFGRWTQTQCRENEGRKRNRHGCWAHPTKPAGDHHHPSSIDQPAKPTRFLAIPYASRSRGPGARACTSTQLRVAATHLHRHMHAHVHIRHLTNLLAGRCVRTHAQQSCTVSVCIFF